MRRWLSAIARSRAARWLGSLQVAVVLLAAFVVALLVGSLVESWHDRPTALQLVYQTYWFILLLTLLWLNILFAAWKKWPWQRRQLGFLITHLGLLTLIAGGTVNAWWGRTGRFWLVDSPDVSFRQFGPQATREFQDEQVSVLEVAAASPEQVWSEVVDPGPVAWDGMGFQPMSGSKTGMGWKPLLRDALVRIARPWRSAIRPRFADGPEVEVIAYHPFSRQSSYGPAEKDEPSFPAVQFQLSSTMTGRLPERWLACASESERVLKLGPGLVEFLGSGLRPEQLTEFLSPPAAPGPRGTLVIGFGAERFSLSLADWEPQTERKLGEIGWRIRLVEYLPNFLDNRGEEPVQPGVSFELLGPKGEQAGFATAARQGGSLFPLRDRKFAGRLPDDLWVWFHPPDYRYGQRDTRAVLQFADAGEPARSQLHFRSWVADETTFAFERSGPLHGEAEIWRPQGWRLTVHEFLPRAVSGPVFEPVSGGEAGPNPTGIIRCRVTWENETRTAWIGPVARRLSLPRDFRLAFRPLTHRLNFAVTLLRAEQKTDRGTNQPARQTSIVEVTDLDTGSTSAATAITLNSPLGHRGFRIYQAGYEFLGFDSRGKPVSRSVFTVGYHPGTYLQYVGATMLAGGIVLMFLKTSRRCASKPDA